MIAAWPIEGQPVENLARVKAVDADAWIVLAASRAVLEWFVAQPFPVFAFGGRFHDLPVACSATRIAPALESVVNALVDQGHRRIVLLAPTFLRKPTPIPSIGRYLSLLEERGIAATDYHLPHFDDTAEGLENCLDGLFRITPPTALMVNQTPIVARCFPFWHGADCGCRRRVGDLLYRGAGIPQVPAAD